MKSGKMNELKDGLYDIYNGAKFDVFIHWKLKTMKWEMDRNVVMVQLPENLQEK